VPVILRSVQLFFQEGASDKVYEAEILEDEGAFTVKVSWGRRGSKLNQGNKAVRVSQEAAIKKFEALIREKRAKGYEERSEERQPAPVAPPEGEGSGSRVQGRREKVGHAAQLLNPIEDHELEAFLQDDTMLAQQKLDGKRVLAHVNGEEVVLTNRNGEVTTAKPHLIEGLLHLPDGTVVDGEVVGEGDSSEFWLFDVLSLSGTDLREKGYLERWRVLEGELEPGLVGAVRVLAVASGEASKRALLQSLRASQAEGIVFKRHDAPYRSGRPASGGTQRKYKLVKSADVVILENAGNAYRMGVYDGSALVEVGKVFAGTTNDSRKVLDQLLAKGERPVAEVRFLYATEDKQLFQPVFVHLRTDKEAQECGYAQLVGTSREVVELTR
jgi:bifunctional non-homologous end joining protein LigD